MPDATFKRKCEICGKDIEGTSPTAVVRNWVNHKNFEHSERSDTSIITKKKKAPARK